jgi:hypothetical protein
MVETRHMLGRRARQNRFGGKSGQESKKDCPTRMVERRCEDSKGNGAIKSWRQEDREGPEENTRCNHRQSCEVGYFPFDELATKS